MARNEKKGYQGYKGSGDSAEDRKNYATRKARALKNAEGKETLSNAVFATQDQVFMDACSAVGIPATPRQASKYRNGYGKVARHLNKSNRKDPEAKRVSI